MLLLSGATGLMYEVVWVRLLGLIFGHTVHAVTTVLVAFMSGLALGSYLSGRRIDRLADLLSGRARDVPAKWCRGGESNSRHKAFQVP